MRVLEDWELESRQSGGSRRSSRFSLTSSLKRRLASGSMTSSKRLALLEQGLLEGGEGGEKGGQGGQKGGRDKKKKKAKVEKERL